MPVRSSSSPTIAKTASLRRDRTITLSYTFFPIAEPRQPVAQASGDATAKACRTAAAGGDSGRYGTDRDHG